jgi:tRNA (guanine10-N2)-dimethyltransferase
VPELFFLLSGENETLPRSELKAILETEGYVFNEMEQFDQVLRLDVDIKCVNAVKKRSAYTRICALELFACEASMTEILQKANSIRFRDMLKNGEAFSVRIKRVKTYSEDLNTMTLEAALGKVVLQSAENVKVNLDTPDKTFIGVLTSNKLIFGVKLAEVETKPYVTRRPRKKPFFHPSAMQSKLARCMVNLSHARACELLLDPFCGTGSILIEASLIGCHVIGIDVQPRMAKGCAENLQHFKLDYQGLIIADGREPPLLRVDHIVTDPPYGRSATTMKSNTKLIIEALLTSAQSMLRKGQRICIAAPKTLNIVQVGTSLGYKHVESHFAYVHRTLTREIAVFEK